MRSPLTTTINRVQGMIAYVRENLDEGEYDLFLDLILPEPEPVKAAKKGRKKSSKGGSKSARAQSLSGAIQRTPKAKVDSDDNEDGPRCAFLMGDNAPCNATEHSPVHKEDGGYLAWHEFQPVASSAAHEAGG